MCRCAASLALEASDDMYMVIAFFDEVGFAKQHRITAFGRRPWALSLSAIAVLEMEVSAEQNRPIKHLLGLIAVRFLPGNVARPCLCATASRSVCTASHSCSALQKQQGMRTAR